MGVQRETGPSGVFVQSRYATRVVVWVCRERDGSVRGIRTVPLCYLGDGMGVHTERQVSQGYLYSPIMPPG